MLSRSLSKDLFLTYRLLALKIGPYLFKMKGTGASASKTKAQSDMVHPNVILLTIWTVKSGKTHENV